MIAISAGYSGKARLRSSTRSVTSPIVCPFDSARESSWLKAPQLEAAVAQRNGLPT